MSTSSSVAAEPATELEQVAFLGSLLAMLSVRELMTLRRLSRRWRGLAASPQFWGAMAESLAGEHALYALEPTRTAIAAAPDAGSAWRRHFLEQLWPARDKWGFGCGGDATARAGFSIQVSVRFRAGPRGTRGLALPLHQFLRVRRGQVAAGGGGRGSSGSKCGGGGGGDGTEDWLASMTPPARFLDPLLGHVMRDPVILPRCGTIVDRASLLAHVRVRGGASPIDGLHVDPARCEDARELRRDIDAWRARAAAARAAGNDVGLDAAQALIDGMCGENLPPEVLRALEEAAVLRDIAKAALLCSAGATASSRRAVRVLDIDSDDSFDGGEEADDDSVAAAAGRRHEEGEQAYGGARGGATGARRPAAAAGDESSDCGGRRRRGDAGRVLSIGAHRVVAFIEGAGVRPFAYSRVHGGDAAQDAVFTDSARAAIAAAVNGFNACVMCYGQTGAGKTHTMFGGNGGGGGDGIVTRACAELLSALAALHDRCGVTSSVSMQYIEIYNERVGCLLAGRVAGVNRHTGAVTGAATVPLRSMSDVAAALAAGGANKRFAATAMNERSSRAHTIVVLHVSQARGGALASTQLHLVDLAGSERVKKSKATGARLGEAIGINGSLLVLGKCIDALVSGRAHVPYLESALTTVLRSAFGGNARTAAIVCAREDDAHADETLQALRFGERLSCVTNAARGGATSLAGALRAIDDAVAACGGQAAALEARGMAHLPAFQRLRERHTQLCLQRAELGHALAPGAGV